MLGLHGVTNESGHFQEDEHESGMRPCTCWCKIFEARADGERHFCHETLLRYVQKAAGDKQWEIDTHEFDDMMATKKFAPGPEGFSIVSTGERQGLGSQFLFDACQCVLEGVAVPAYFAASRTVFIPKFSDVDDNGLIARPLDALHPWTLCYCDCWIITTAIYFGLYRCSIRCILLAQRCISIRVMTDNIFEVENDCRGLKDWRIWRLSLKSRVSS